MGNPQERRELGRSPRLVAPRGRTNRGPSPRMVLAPNPLWEARALMPVSLAHARAHALAFGHDLGSPSGHPG